MKSRTAFLLGVAAGATAAALITSYEEMQWRREQRTVKDLENRAEGLVMMYGKPSKGKSFAGAPIAPGDMVYMDFESKVWPYTVQPPDVQKDIMEFLWELANETDGYIAPMIQQRAKILLDRTLP